MLIWNPVAGRWPEGRIRSAVEQLAQGLRAGGWTAEVVATTAEGGATAAAEAGIREGYTVLAACGGDGTLQQIADVVAAHGAAGELAPSVAALPWGTANIYGRALGCPVEAKAAGQWLLKARPMLKPLGRVSGAEGQRHFLAVVSVGLDAAVVHGLKWKAKRRWGKLAYAWAALCEWPQYFPAAVTFEQDGRPRRADGLIVGLTPYYGGRMRLGEPGADGSIALALHGSPMALPLQGLWLALCRLEGAPGVERLASGAMRITTPGLPVEIDGEAAGRTPVEIEIEPAGLRVLSR